MSASMYVAMVLQTSRVFEQFSTFVTGVASAPTIAVESFTHTIYEYRVITLDDILCLSCSVLPDKSWAEVTG